MKKFASLMVAVLISVASFAQQQGDSYLSGMIGVSGGTQKTTLNEDRNLYSENQPLSSSFSIGVEYAYFIKNNLRTALCLSTSTSSSPTTNTSLGWLKSKVFSVNINPNIAYHVRLTDNLYYTPEIGLSLEIGSVKTPIDRNTSYKLPGFEWGAYVHLLALEFKVTEKIAIGANICSLSYANITIWDNSSDISSTANQLKFDLNDSSINFRYYF